MSEFDKLFESFFVGFPTDNQSTTYPPHNVIKFDEEKYLLELAVAGIPKDQINVEVKQNTLSVSFQPDNIPSKDRTYIHRGISSRRFEKRFSLAGHLVVEKATQINGILSVYLRRDIPEKDKPKKIDIL